MEQWIKKTRQQNGNSISLPTNNWAEVALVVKNLPANTGDGRDVGSIPGVGRSPGGGRGNPLEYSCPQYPMDRGAWRATVHRVTQTWAWLKQLNTHVPIIILNVENLKQNYHMIQHSHFWVYNWRRWKQYIEEIPISTAAAFYNS